MEFWLEQVTTTPWIEGFENNPCDAIAMKIFVACQLGLQIIACESPFTNMD